MVASTITDAVREIRALHPTRSGRLLGIRVHYSHGSRPDQWLGNTPQPWYDRLQAGITARTTGTATPDSPEYLVLSDQVVVAVLTAAAHLVLPDYPLSRTQARHQALAAQALADLPRHILRQLADHRAAMDDRTQDAAAEHRPHPDGALRVAPAADPTNTRWIRIGADLHQARATAASACHTEPDQVLIVTAAGYGQYGRTRHRLDLPILCAMHELADTHQVSLSAVGDWLDAEGATTAQVAPADIQAQFAASYLGPFADRTAYTQHRMAQLGWSQALATAGIPERYLDLEAITRDWFSQHVRAVPSGTWDHIEVFHRHHPAPGPALTYQSHEPACGSNC
jgi:hypothetical protein